MVSKQHIRDRFNKPAQISAACGNTCIPVPPACKALFACRITFLLCIMCFLRMNLVVDVRAARPHRLNHVQCKYKLFSMLIYTFAILTYCCEKD